MSVSLGSETLNLSFVDLDKRLIGSFEFMFRYQLLSSLWIFEHQLVINIDHIFEVDISECFLDSLYLSS
jgi:hypothetical protein